MQNKLKQVRELAPDDRSVCLSLDLMSADHSALAGWHERAIREYEKVLDQYDGSLQDPEHRWAYEDAQRRRAISLVHLDRFHEALPILRDAVTYESSAEDLQETRYYLGLCCMHFEWPDSAKKELRHVIELGLKNDIEIRARYELGVVYFLNWGFAQARLQLETILQMFPNQDSVPLSYIYQQLARVHDYLGEKEEAKRYEKLARDSSH